MNSQKKESVAGDMDTPTTTMRRSPRGNRELPLAGVEFCCFCRAHWRAREVERAADLIPVCYDLERNVFDTDHGASLARKPWPFAFTGKTTRQPGDLDEKFAVDLVHPCRLVFKPNHETTPRKHDGGIDTEQVSAIMILDVIDYP